MDNEMLVSVRVVSYNAEKTIIETLESIKNQTYSNIELIVSDDCSKDNTVSVVREWLKSNQKRFVRTELLTVEENTGICANMNRAWKVCTGEWIKGIAADDILLPNCIEDFMIYVAEHPDSHFIASLQRVYNETFQECNYIKTTGYIGSNFLNMSIDKQLRYVAYGAPMMAPSIITSRELIETIGGYDERYSYEDHPLYITMLEHGFKINFLNKETVGYRVHTSTYNVSGRLFNPSFVKCTISFIKERCFKYFSWRQKLAHRLMWICYDVFERYNMNKSSKINSSIYKGIMSALWHLGRVK